MLAGGIIGIVPIRRMTAAAVADFLVHRVETVASAVIIRIAMATGAAAGPRAQAFRGTDHLATAAAPLGLRAVLELAAPGLEASKVLAIDQAVVGRASGGRADPQDTRPALVANFAATKTRRWRSGATPLLGLEAGEVVLVGAEGAIEAVVDGAVGSRRRATSSPNRVMLAARSGGNAAIGERTPRRPPGGLCPVSQ